MTVLDWIGIALLIPFMLLVVGLIISFIAGCLGSTKRRQQVLRERMAARQARPATRSQRETPHAGPVSAISDAADGL